MPKTDLELPTFDGNRLEYHTWLRRIHSAAFDFEAFVGHVSFYLLSDDEWAHLPDAGYAPAHLDAQGNPVPEHLAEPFEPFPSPAYPPAGATAVVMQRYTMDLNHYQTQQNDLMSFRRALVKALGPNVQLFLAGPNQDIPMSALTLDQIMDQLHTEYGTLTHSDIQTLRSRLQIIYDPSAHANIHDYLKVHLDAHSALATHGFPMSEFDKIEHLKNGLLPCGRFNSTLITFHQQYPNPATAQLSHLTSLVKNTPVELHPTAHALGYSAAAPMVVPTTESTTALVARLLELEHLLTRTLNTANAVVAAKHKPTKPVLYCWTHGSCSHASSECRNPAAGHQAGATLQNTMNGSTHTATSQRSNRKKN